MTSPYRHHLGTFARVLLLAISVLSSFYAMAAYIPDTYFIVVRAPAVSLLPRLVRLQPLLLALASLLVAVPVIADSRISRRLRLAFVAVLAAFVLLVVVLRPLASLDNGTQSYGWAVLLLFPLVWVGGFDCRVELRRAAWPAFVPRVSLAAGVAAALAVAIVFRGAPLLRAWFTGSPTGLVDGALWVWFGIALADVLCFLVVFGLASLAEALAARGRSPFRDRAVLLAALLAFALSVFMYRAILGSVPFPGTDGIVYSAFVGVAVIAACTGVWLRSVSLAPAERPSPRRRDALVVAGALLLAAFVVPRAVGLLDWNFVVSKIWTAAFWAAACLVALRLAPRPRRVLPLRFALALVVSAYGIFILVFGSSGWAAARSFTGVAPPIGRSQALLERHLYFDSSFRLVRAVFPTFRGNPCDDLCRFLQSQSNIRATFGNSIPRIDLVDHLQPAAGPRPNIFFILIDSLRQDFVSAYNPATDYTPQITRFAADSLVFRNAFTRYGGSALSTPAIWAGAMVLHKQFPQPFSNVDNLQKLIAVDGYKPYVTVDPSKLQIILKDSPDMVHLEPASGKWTDIEFCSTAAALERNLASRDPSRPIFFFSQPEDIHLVSIAAHHPEFRAHTAEDLKPLYIEDLRRVDSCFGQFIAYLKANGLYDNSIIVVAADHGEFGHDSHAFSVEPDVVRIPLILHIPASMREKYVYDLNAPAFTTDITPTLYYLLGHRPIRNDELLGRPLLTETAQERAAYERNSYLLVSSYSPIYGVLDRQGRMLYVQNEVDHTTKLFDLAAGPDADRDPVIGIRIPADDDRIRRHVQHIADEFDYRAHPMSFLGWLLH